ncbi:MAG: beta-ketoacyl-[acyl-carrier-protein] synthase family protein [Deltaproteobacteria bacterium]|nr:beta-ketoacyl-[acyl-carrier-protein] synthase family protein [Deltaproteobacteria bacterium]
MRIWVTGIGIASPLGRDAATTFAALTAGTRAFGPVTLFDPTGCRSSIAAEVPDFTVAEAAPRSGAEGWSRTDAMSVLAARQALAQAELDPTTQPVDLLFGGTTAGMLETEGLLADMHEAVAARRPLARMLSHPLSATVDRLRDAVAPFGRARTLCSACSSGANALVLAAAWLRTGRSERVLAGGGDGLCRLTYTGFSCLGALSAEPCRPFDRDRAGLSMGEGAALLVLETEASARARGVEPIVELRGWAVGAEAHHITNPEASGATAARVMNAALARGGLTPADIDYVNAHGTATRHNDPMEAQALAHCLGDRLGQVAVSSSKGQLGHTLGAAGAIEAAITAMTVARGVIPPNMGLVEPEPELPLDLVREARRGPVRAGMSNSFGFGGSDTVLVFAEPGRFPEPAGVEPRSVFVTATGSVGALGVGGTDAARGYVEVGDPAPVGGVDFDAATHLDLARVRRVDRVGRFCVVAMNQAIGSAGWEPTPGQLERFGAIMGTAFGSVDDCSAFIHRTFEKGAKFASPAVFPSLLPSSPVAHASIYHGLRGPVFAPADLGATSESAVITAIELIAADEADAMLAGGVEQTSPITEAVLGPLCSTQGEAGTEGHRSEGAAATLVESGQGLAARGGRPLARVAWWTSWRGTPAEPLAGLPAPGDLGAAARFSARDDDGVRALLAGTAWASVPKHTTTDRAGTHEGAGGFALAAAVAMLAAGDLDAALVLGLAPDRGYVLYLTAGPTADAVSAP